MEGQGCLSKMYSSIMKKYLGALHLFEIILHISGYRYFAALPLMLGF